MRIERKSGRGHRRRESGQSLPERGGGDLRGERRLPEDQKGGVCRLHRPIRQREDDPHQHDRVPRQPYLRYPLAGGKPFFGGGKPLSEKELTRVRRELFGYVFQKFYLIPTLDVRENILLPCAFFQKNGAERKLPALPRNARPGEKGAPPAGAALRRGDAEGGDRPCPDQRPGDPPG